MAWRVNRRLARAWLRLTRTPMSVHGMDRLPAGPCVMVCNHGSYIDGMLLIAALPRPFAFVAKGELRRSFALRTFLERLGTEFVDRFSAEHGVADAAHLALQVSRGRSLLFFPEGTFTATPGLLPLHVGAFLTAVRGQVPVVPMVLHGNREMLPVGSWWPRRARIDLDIGAPLRADDTSGETFAAAISLREAAQQFIARRIDVR